MQSQDEDIADNPESPPPLADETADYSYHADERNNRYLLVRSTALPRVRDAHL